MFNSSTQIIILNESSTDVKIYNNSAMIIGGNRLLLCWLKNTLSSKKIEGFYSIFDIGLSKVGISNSLFSFSIDEICYSSSITTYRVFIY